MTAYDYEYLRKLLRERSGLMLASEKDYLLESRLLPVIRKNGLVDIGGLVARLKAIDGGPLIDEVVEAMTNNESLFFRDKTPFDHFRNTIMPALIEARAESRRIRIWCAAASSGQEPYTLAICLKEAGRALKGWDVEILATDLSTEVLEKAKSGVYTQFEVQRGLPVLMLIKYFSQVGECWQIAPEIRDMVSFRSLNLLHDFAQLGPFDVVFCRNVLIYFDQSTKTDVLDRLAQVLVPDGYLVLGAAETVVGLTAAFRPVHDRHGLYRPAMGHARNDTVIDFRHAAALRAASGR